MDSDYSPSSTQEHFYVMKGRPHSHYNCLNIPTDIERYINILLDIADTLGIDDFAYSSYSSTIDRLDDEEVAVTRSHLLMQQVEGELTHHLASSLHQEQLIQKWSKSLLETSSSDVSKVASGLERRKVALTVKAREYQKELDELMVDMPEAPSISVTELAAIRAELKGQEQLLEEKRAKVAAFQGLPPNIELAKHVLREARDEQMELTQLRERLLRKMVDGVS